MSCDHEVGEDTNIELSDSGYLTSTCRLCDRLIYAVDIDHEYFKDSNELVVLEWRDLENL